VVFQDRRGRRQPIARRRRSEHASGSELESGNENIYGEHGHEQIMSGTKLTRATFVYSLVSEAWKQLQDQVDKLKSSTLAVITLSKHLHHVQP
jgi:hypothetical protein